MQTRLEQHEAGRHGDGEQVEVRGSHQVRDRADEPPALDEGRRRLQAESGHAVEETCGHAEQWGSQVPDPAPRPVGPVRYHKKGETDRRGWDRGKQEVQQARRATCVIHTRVDRQTEQDQGDNDGRQGQPLHAPKTIVQHEM